MNWTLGFTYELNSMIYLQTEFYVMLLKSIYFICILYHVTRFGLPGLIATKLR